MICFQPTKRRILLIVAALLIWQFAPSTISAQVVTGTVSDARTGVPVGSGFVVLLDLYGIETARSLFSRTGSFRVRAPGPGVYRLRTERIGYEAFVSAPIEVPAAGEVSLDLAITGLPIRLATIEVRREDRCRVSPEQNAETAVVWEEIRKALAAASWTESQGLYHTVSNVYERDMDGRGRRVLSESHRPSIGYSLAPFVSRDPGELARDGYVITEDETTAYFGPDAAVLQDEEFLRTHCYSLRRESRDGHDLIGLAFEPMPGRDMADVQGVLWLDRQTSELRLLDFSYTNLPYDPATTMTPGGSVEFLPLPGGTWAVRRWQIDIPTEFRDERVSDFDRSPRRFLERRRRTGGEVLTVALPDDSVVYQAVLAELTGVVIDSMASEPEPMPGAVVRIGGTWFADTTDLVGRFRVLAPLDGDYSVVITHPRLDSIGFLAPPRPVTLARGHIDTVTLSMPRLTDVLADLCPNNPAGAYGRVLVGAVRDSLTGTAAAGAQVAASWQLIESVQPLNVRNRESVVTADVDGRYVFCDLEFGRPALVYAVAGEAQSQMVRVSFEAGGVEVGDEFHETSRAIWRVDLPLSSTSAQSTLLAGTVIDANTGDAVPGVLVAVEGFDETSETDRRGLFALAGVPPGRQQITLRRLGYRTRTGEVEIAADQPSLIDSEFLALSPVAQITGTIFEAESDRPVSDVWVTLLSDSGTAVTMTRTDDLGRYALSAPEPGAYRVLARRIGYAAIRVGPFELETGRTFENDISFVQFAVALDTLTVSAEVARGYLEEVGFYRRQRTSAAGYFLDRAAVESRLGRVSNVAELLIGLTGVEVEDAGAGSFGTSLNFERGKLSMADAFGVATACSSGPRVIVDGVEVHNAPIGRNHITLSGVVRPEEVYGVEVYRTPSQIPIEYGGPESACGVLVIWTINGRY